MTDDSDYDSDDFGKERLFSAVRVMSSGAIREKTEVQARPATAPQDRPGAVSGASDDAGSGGRGPGGVQRASLSSMKSEARRDAATAVQDRPGAVSTEHVSLAGRNNQQRPSHAGRAKQGHHGRHSWRASVASATRTQQVKYTAGQTDVLDLTSFD